MRAPGHAEGVPIGEGLAAEGLAAEVVEVRVADFATHLGQAILIAQEVDELRWLHRRERCIDSHYPGGAIRTVEKILGPMKKKRG